MPIIFFVLFLFIIASSVMSYSLNSYIDGFHEIQVPKEEIALVNNYMEKIQLYVRYGAKKIDYLDMGLEADEMKILADTLPGSNVTCLDFMRGYMDEECTEILFKSLACPDTKVSCIYLDESNFVDYEALAKALKENPNPNLEYVSITETEMETQDLKNMLARGLIQANLSILALSGNNIGVTGAELLASYLPKSNIRGFLLRSTGIGANGVKALTSAIQTSPNNKIEQLEVGGNPIDLDPFLDSFPAFPSSFNSIGFSCEYEESTIRKIDLAIAKSKNISGLQLTFYKGNQDQFDLTFTALTDLLRNPRLLKVALGLFNVRFAITDPNQIIEITKIIAESRIHRFQISLFKSLSIPAEAYENLKSAVHLKDFHFPGKTDLNDENVVKSLCAFISGASSLETLYLYPSYIENNNGTDGMPESLEIKLSEAIQSSKSLQAVVFLGYHENWLKVYFGVFNRVKTGVRILRLR